MITQWIGILMVCVMMISIIIIIQARLWDHVILSWGCGAALLWSVWSYSQPVPTRCLPHLQDLPRHCHISWGTKFPLFESHGFKPARMTIWGL